MATGDRYQGEWYIIIIFLNLLIYLLNSLLGLMEEKMDKVNIHLLTAMNMKDISKWVWDKERELMFGVIEVIIKGNGIK
jgi:hypothetical protein